MLKRAEERSGSLGLVWVECPYPVVALGLRDLLEEDAEVHFGPEPPEGEELSCVVLCPNGAEDIPSGIKRLRSMAPEAPVLIFGLRIDLQLARTGLQKGARGFIHAGMEPGQIVRALSIASNGQVVAPRELITSLVAGEDIPVDLDSLTYRQREILTLVAEGLTNGQIAHRLFLSEFTIKQHLRAAYKQLKVKNRTEAAKLIRQSNEPGV